MSETKAKLDHPLTFHWGINLLQNICYNNFCIIILSSRFLTIINSQVFFLYLWKYYQFTCLLPAGNIELFDYRGQELPYLLEHATLLGASNWVISMPSWRPLSIPHQHHTPVTGNHLTSITIIRSDHNFEHVTTAQLLWHVQNHELIGLLESK